jgi:hypothetical protein
MNVILHPNYGWKLFSMDEKWKIKIKWKSYMNGITNENLPTLMKNAEKSK